MVGVITVSQTRTCDTMNCVSPGCDFRGRLGVTCPAVRFMSISRWLEEVYKWSSLDLHVRVCALSVLEPDALCLAWTSVLSF